VAQGRRRSGRIPQSPFSSFPASPPHPPRPPSAPQEDDPELRARAATAARQLASRELGCRDLVQRGALGRVAALLRDPDQAVRKAAFQCVVQVSSAWRRRRLLQAPAALGAARPRAGAGAGAGAGAQGSGLGRRAPCLLGGPSLGPRV
jgi:hypothetical protein